MKTSGSTWVPNEKWPRGVLTPARLAALRKQWPRDPRLWAIQGDQKAREGQSERAVAAWRIAIKHFRGHEAPVGALRQKIAGAFIRKGNVAAATRQLRRAAELFAHAQERPPSSDLPAYAADLAMREAVCRAAIGEILRARRIVKAVPPGELRDSLAGEISAITSKQAKEWALGRIACA